jgi:hypothetical protein
MQLNENQLLAAEFINKIKTIAKDVFDEVGQAADNALRESISEPYPPASRRGNPPHMRTGSLYSGVQSNVSVTDVAAEYKQASTRAGTPEVPWILEDPRQLDRPHVAPIKKEYENQFFETFVAVAKEALHD